MATQASSIKLRGVVCHPNIFSASVREGSLARAESVRIDSENLIEPRRGVPFDGFTPIGTPGQAFGQLIPYDGVLLAHIGSSIYRRTAADTWSANSGTFDVPAAGYRIRDVQMQGSLYLAGSTGIRVQDSAAGSSLNLPDSRHPPLDGRASTTGSSGFLADTMYVGYRATFYTLGLRMIKHETAPSARVIVQNTAGGAATRDVLVRFYLPSSATVTAGTRTKVFRSAQATAVPSDELQLVYEARLTSTDVSNGYFEFTDSTPDDLRGETIYTAPSQQGAAQANTPPPHVRDIAVFADCLFGAYITSKHRFFLDLIGTSTTGAGIRHFTDATVGTTSGNGILTGISSTTTLRVGMRAKGTGVNALARILSIDSATQVTVSHNSSATATVSVEFGDVLRIGGVEYFAASATVAGSREFLVSLGGTPSQNIEATAREIEFVVNRDGAATMYAFYQSSFEGKPGQLLFEERSINGSSCQFSSTAGTAFSPALPSTDDASQVSSQDVKPDHATVSKSEQPQAHPLGNTIRLGNTPLKRILALRAALVVLSDVVGLVTGTGPGNFRYDELDPSIKLIAPETARVVNDAVYCCSNQGIVRITPNGVEIAGREIENEIRRLAKLASFESVAHAASYESDRAYILFVPTGGADTYAKFAWRLNLFSNDWTHAIVDASCAVVDPVGDTLCIGDSAASLMRRENKTLDFTDYYDGSLPVNITASDGLTVDLTSSANLLVNDVLVQGANVARIDAIDGNALTMRTVQAWANGAATAFRPVDCSIDYLPWHGGDPLVKKVITHITLLFPRAEFGRFTVFFATDFEQNFTHSVTCHPGEFGSDWGTTLPAASASNNHQPVRLEVPFPCQECHWMKVRIVWSICLETMAFGGIDYEVAGQGPGYRGSHAA